MKLLQTLSSAFLHFVKESLLTGERRHQPGSTLRFAETTRFGPTLLLVAGLSLAASSSAQPAQPSEYQIKAAFIFNFAKFVEWPLSTFENEKSPLVIGVLGDNPFGADLERFLHDKAINDHPLTVRECHTLEEAKKCHVLFISGSEKKRLEEIFKALQGANVLTVGETDGFTEAGGIVNFVSEGNKIRFQINDASAKRAGLKISSKLLTLAAPRRASAGISPTTARQPGQPPRRFRQSALLQAGDFRGAAHSAARQQAVSVANGQFRPLDADKNPG